MWSQRMSEISRLKVFPALVAFILTLISSRGAPTPQIDSNATFSIAIELTSSTVDSFIAQTGYIPADPPSITVWRGFPAVRKIEAGWFAAEAAHQGNGELFLTRLTHLIALDSENAKADPRLARYLARPDTTTIAFARVTPNPADFQLPPQVRESVKALAFHLDGGPVGGLYGVLSVELRLAEDDIYEILRTEPDTKSALEAGLIRHGEPPPIASQIAEIADDLMKESEAARSDPKVIALARERLQQQISEDSRNVPKPFEYQTPKQDLPRFRSIASALSDPKPPPGPMAPSDPRKVLNTLEAPAADTYKALQAREFGNVTVTFADAINTVRGWGGIVFGSPVRSSPDVPAPLEVAFRPNPSHAPNGHLIFFTAHEVLETELLSSEDVQAAYQILFAGAGGFGPAKSGDPIGLVGYIDSALYFDLADNGNRINEGIRFRPVIHPALEGLELAHVVTRLDGYPILKDALPDMVKQAAGQEIADRVNDWLKRTGETWKLTDVLTVVTRDHEKVSVERDDQDGKWPSLLKTQAFLNFISFDDKGQPITDDTFYSLLPDLTRTFADYNRVNNFARTFALLRWAHDAGAQFVLATLPKVSAADTVGSVIVSSKGIVEAPRCRYVDAVDEQRIKIEQAIAKLLTEAPPEVKRLDAGLAYNQSKALTMVVEVQQDAEWGITPPPQRNWRQRLGGLLSGRAAHPTQESLAAALKAALPSAKPIVETMIGFAGDPTNTAYRQTVKDRGPERALYAAIKYFLPNKWDWYTHWYSLRKLGVDMVLDPFQVLAVDMARTATSNSSR